MRILGYYILLMFKSEENAFEPCAGKTLFFQINYHDTVITDFNWFMKKVLKILFFQNAYLRSNVIVLPTVKSPNII